MKFAELCAYFERIEATPKRLVKTEILAELLKKVAQSEVRVVVNLALGQLAAPYERIEFNLAEKMLIRAIALLGKTSVPAVTQQYKQIGDVGVLVQRLREGEETREGVAGGGPGIQEVYDKLVAIAQETGTGSQERKVRGLMAMLTECSGVEAKYIVRIVNESLRLGFSESTMLDVFSYYACGGKDYSGRLEKAYQMRPDLALLGEEVVTKGIEKTLSSAQVTLGIPVIPALAQRLSSVDEMIEKMGRVLVENKLDGTRVQIQFSRERNQKSEIRNQKSQTALFEEEKPKVWVKTFTRNLDENTAQFPELTRIEGELAANEVILDAEAVGYEEGTGKLLPFQMTITRKRKHGVAEAEKNVPLKFFVFDILYLDGKTLLGLPLSARREILGRVIGHGPTLILNKAIETESPAEIRDYHAAALAEGYEGVLVKKKEGIYEPGRVGFNWVKLKEVENATGKLADTLDCVVMGYYLGKGKRSVFGIGAFLVGVSAGEEILTIAKIGTGLSDEEFRTLQAELAEAKSEVIPGEYRVERGLTPDIWVKPRIVVEVAADEVTISPSHTAGLALRFPRLVKRRLDKSVAEITTIDEVKAILAVSGGKGK